MKNGSGWQVGWSIGQSVGGGLYWGFVQDVVGGGAGRREPLGAAAHFPGPLRDPPHGTAALLLERRTALWVGIVGGGLFRNVHRWPIVAQCDEVVVQRSTAQGKKRW